MAVAGFKRGGGETAFRERRAVVRLARVVRRDRHLLAYDLEFFVNCRHKVVANLRLNTCLYVNVVNSSDYVRLRANISNCTLRSHLNLKLMIITIRKAFDSKFTLCKRRTIINLFFTFCCDRYRSTRNLQCAANILNPVTERRKVKITNV